jgi:tyrosine-protein phosphatase SIW14
VTRAVSQRHRVALLLLSATMFCATCTAGEPPAGTDTRSSRWAEPITSYPGLPNMFRVSDGLFRGAQPSRADGYASLAEMGIKTVVNLRGGHDEEDLCRRHELDYVYIPMKAWSFEEEDVVRFLQVASRPENQPVFVHCRRGADRAGMAVAAYRVVVEGWSREDALFEMTEGPYGYNPRWKKLARFVEDLDVDRLREAAGLTAPGSVSGGQGGR